MVVNREKFERIRGGWNWFSIVSNGEIDFVLEVLKLRVLYTRELV